ncbi:MAG: DNA polymerase III subunit delta [Gammaproteobacteria bacterium]|nr:DNA polymerase III subunit delta [Gammaproteobacteria bacterium]
MVPAPGAAEALAERVEGNLLAAQQEIDKLALLVGKGTVEIATLEEAVARSARYDVFKLQDAALRGDAERALRILEGLRAEGEQPTLVLWALSSSIRAVWNSSRGLQAVPVWQRPPAGLSDAVRRLKAGQICQRRPPPSFGRPVPRALSRPEQVQERCDVSWHLGHRFS